MKISISQIYIEPGVEYPFSRKFQVLITKELTQCTPASNAFAQAYGEEWKVIIRVSAKRGLSQSELRGPTVFKRSKDVEYTIFLPFADDAMREFSRVELEPIIRQLFHGIGQVLRLLYLDSGPFEVSAESLVKQILSDPSMFEQRIPPRSA